MSGAAISATLAHLARTTFAQSCVAVASAQDAEGAGGTLHLTLAPATILTLDALDALALDANLALPDMSGALSWLPHISTLRGRLDLTLRWHVRSLKRGGGIESVTEEAAVEEGESDAADLSPWARDVLRACGTLAIASATEQALVAHHNAGGAPLTLAELEAVRAASRRGTVLSVTAAEGGALELLLRHNVFVPIPQLSHHKRHCAGAPGGGRH